MKSSPAWLVLLVASLSACKGAAPLPPKAIELNRAGVEALAEGDLETAEARFELALEYNPHFVEALVNQGLVELERGNFDRARQLLHRAERLNPDVAQPYHGLGVLAEREHRPDLAAERYREALRVDPGFSPARLNLARLLFDAGMLDRARLEFKRLVEVAPDEPAGYAGLAEALLRLGRVPEAEQAGREGVARFPADAHLIILSARSELRHGRTQRAVELLTPLAVGRDGVAAEALAWLATAELSAQRLRHAAGAAKRALELSPEEPVAVYALALALHGLGDAHAREWLLRARALSPGEPIIEAALAGGPAH
ncbi:MAG: tetratricopeptide repeat protein [Sorangiineae bacterium]|nr:tetratricopeptide repeat protein [Polyangiaceae bacterium]MEB2324231.1 tetratricopeptide repeat protein [Sorangiineae bacterium]